MWVIMTVNGSSLVLGRVDGPVGAAIKEELNQDLIDMKRTPPVCYPSTCDGKLARPPFRRLGRRYTGSESLSTSAIRIDTTGQ